jgi:hypothetical protein
MGHATLTSSRIFRLYTGATNREAAMWKFSTIMMLAAPVLIVSHACHAAPAGLWEEDFRRCMIYQAIDGGRVVVANDEGRLEIDVQREGDATGESDATKYVITLDNRAPIDAASSKNAGAGIYDHWLGNYAAVAPIFAKARQLTILITAAAKPAETITIPIRNGAKAMAFLKKCDDHWRNFRKKQR